MAFPTILFNSSTGSNTAASGAGPATALTGTAGATSGTGLVVTLDGSPDLTNVAVDGSHAIYIAATGGRQFSPITAKDNGAKTVTVSLAFPINLTAKTWAIGGKRLSLAGSSRLYDDGGTSGDFQAGWIFQLESGYTETFSAAMPQRAPTAGGVGQPVTRAAPGFTVKPILTWSNNGEGFRIASNGLVQDIELRNTSATKTASTGFTGSTASTVIERCTIAHSTNRFWKGMTSVASSDGGRITDCEIGYTVSHGIELTGTAGQALVNNNYIHDCGGNGLYHNVANLGNRIFYGNVIVGCAGHGIEFSAGNTSAARGCYAAIHNTIYNNGGDGIRFTQGPTHITLRVAIALNNICASNGGYGINVYDSGTPWTLDTLGGMFVFFRGNNLYNNASGADFPVGVSQDGTIGNPGFINVGGLNFAIGTNMLGTGYPTTALANGVLATYSYVDPGVAQRSEPATPVYKAFLVLNTYGFNPDHVFVSDVVAHEVTGTTRQTLASRTVTQDDTSDAAEFTASPVTFPSVPASQALGGMWIYRFVSNDSDSVLYSFHPCAGTTDGGNVTITPPADGFIQQH